MTADGSTVTIIFDDGATVSRQAMALVLARGIGATATWTTCAAIKPGHEIRMSSGEWKSVAKLEAP